MSEQSAVGVSVDPQGESEVKQTKLTSSALSFTKSVDADAAASVATLQPRAPMAMPAADNTSVASSKVSFGGPTLASLPPRVGLVKRATSFAPLHRPAASSGTATSGGDVHTGGVRGAGVKIVGNNQGVRRPGLQKNVVVLQRLHHRPEN